MLPQVANTVGIRKTVKADVEDRPLWGCCLCSEGAPFGVPHDASANPAVSPVVMHPNDVVFVKADSRAKYERVVDVVDNLRAAGVDNVGLLTELQQEKSAQGGGTAAPATPAQ